MGTLRKIKADEKKFFTILRQTGEQASMTDGVVRRLPVKLADGSIDLIDVDGIFYLESRGHDTLIRTKRKKPYHSVQRLGELGKKLPVPAFFRCHREYIVNMNRVRSLTPRSSRGYDLRLDPPVNQRIPIARDRLEEIRKILGG